MQIHELNNFTGILGSDTYLAIDNGTDTSKVSAQALSDMVNPRIGTPLVAATAAAMTDHDKIYVYVGSETGYTNGNWYYWNGSAWASGGVYNSTAFVTDTTLTQAGKAADAKVTGDEITDLKSALNDTQKSIQYDIGETYYYDQTVGAGIIHREFKAGEYGEVYYKYYAGAETTNIDLYLSKTGQSNIVLYPNGLQYHSVGSKASFIIPPEADGYDTLNIHFNGVAVAQRIVEVSLGWNNEARQLVKYNLYNGMINTSGIISANSSRKTTGVIPYSFPLQITVNKGYRVNYLYGTKNNSLTDGGSLISDGGTAVLNLDTTAVSCIALVFTKLSGSLSTNDEIGIVMTSVDSNDSNLVRMIRSNENAIANTSANVGTLTGKTVLYKGIATDTSGGTFVLARSATTLVLPYNSTLKVSVNYGYDLAYNIGETATSFTDKSWKISGGGTYEITDSPSTYHYISFNVKRSDNATFTDDDVANIGLVITDLGGTLDKLTELIYQQKIDLITSGTTVSDITNTLAVSDGFDIGEDGLMCAGASMASNAAGEWSDPAWNGYLITANIADVEKTKKTTKVFPLWGTLPVFNGWSINFVQHSIAKRTDDDEISILAEIGLQYDEDTKVVYAVRKYTPSTDTLASDAVLCDIDVLGTTYDMIYDNGTLAKDDIEAIWSATDIEHPVGYAGVNQYKYTIGQNPKLYNGYYYLPVGLGNHSHALCKTADLIHWEFVCDIPLSQASEEVAVAFYDDVCYATSRGNYTVDSQYSKITKCDTDELDGEHWSTPIVLAGCKLERPTIACLNNKVYVMQGTGTGASIEGHTIARSKKVMLVFDTSLNLIKRTDITFLYPVLHPQFLVFGGNMWMLTSSDKRCFAYTVGGDGRSELSFAHIDEKIMEL